MQRLILLFILLFPAAAFAQAGTTWNLATEGMIPDNNDFASPNLNRAACGNTTAIQITVKLSTVAAPTSGSATLFVWWAASGSASCVATVPTSAAEGLLGSRPSILIGDTFLAAQTTLTIPDDLNSTSLPPSLTWADVMNREPSACDTSSGFVGIDQTSVRLCFGLDVQGDGSIDLANATTSKSFDNHGWVNFDVKTMPPPAPDAPEVVSLDSQLDVKLKVTSTGDATHAGGDIASYRVIARELPVDPAVAAETPDQWATGTYTETTATASNTGDFAADATVTGTNGITYQVAAFARDSVDNEGPVSAVASGSPHPECDFAKCYPGGIKPGCNAAGGGPLAGLLAFLGLARRRLSRRERAS